MTVRMEMVHETDFSPGKGHETYAWPSMIISRRKIQVEDGRFVGDLKDGHPRDLGRDSQERAALIRREHTR